MPLIDWPKELYEELCRIGAQARALRGEGKLAEAEKLFLQMWDLAPEPKNQWSAIESLALGIAAFYVETAQGEKAKAWIPNIYVTKDVGAVSHLFIMEGRIHLAAGDEAKAKELFQKAVADGGKTAFRGENKQFLKYVETGKVKSKKPAAKKAGKTGSAAFQWPVVPAPEAYKRWAGPLELDDDVHEKIVALSAEGDELCEAEDLKGALEKYREALALLPRPVEKWDAAVSVYAALGDVLFQMRDYKEANRALTDVMFCQDAPENAFVRLRMGQVAFELGDVEKARTELAEAVRLHGEEIFDGEDEKYRALV